MKVIYWRLLVDAVKGFAHIKQQYGRIVSGIHASPPVIDGKCYKVLSTVVPPVCKLFILNCSVCDVPVVVKLLEH